MFRWLLTCITGLLAAALLLSTAFDVTWVSRTSAAAFWIEGAGLCWSRHYQLGCLLWCPPKGWSISRSAEFSADWLTTWPVFRRDEVIVPLGLPLLVFAAPTVFFWWRDRRRIPPGHCLKCGYNLTGNVSGRCPECGTAVPARGTGT